jgi:hypothetical protein
MTVTPPAAAPWPLALRLSGEAETGFSLRVSENAMEGIFRALL